MRPVPKPDPRPEGEQGQLWPRDKKRPAPRPLAKPAVAAKTQRR